MLNVNVTNFRKNIFSLLEQTIKYDEPLNISTKDGNAILLSEDEYLGMTTSLSLLSNPVMKEKLIEGKNTSLEKCIPEEEVEW